MSEGLSDPFRLYGIVPTHYTATNLRVDVPAISAAVADLVGKGVTHFLTTGAYGEFQNLSDDERLSVLTAVRDVPGVSSVMACAAQPSSRATADLVNRMTDAGADSVMISAPFVAELTEAEILYHFDFVADRAKVPLVVYNNPVFGTDLSPRILSQIVENAAIRAIKQGTRQIGNLIDGLSAVRRSAGDRVKVLAASDLAASASLPTGVDGLTSTNCWVFPEAFTTMAHAAERNDWARVSAVALALTEYRAVTQALGQPRTVKAAMCLRGLPGSPCMRAPYRELNEHENASLAEALALCDAALAVLDEDLVHG